MATSMHWPAIIIFLTSLNPDYVNREDIDGCLTFVCYDLLTSLEMAMFGISAVPKAAKFTAENHASASSGSVAEELKMFGKECKCRCRSVYELSLNQLSPTQIPC